MANAAQPGERSLERGGAPPREIPDLRKLFATSPDEALRAAWRYAGDLVDDQAGAEMLRFVLTAFVYEAGTSGRQRLGED
jgi:hypothetical protein